MTSFNREPLPDAVRTNGATPNPWWSNAVVYQIYPRSFQDTNGDGFGDLKGITSRLDYLADLGVDVLWLSPVYRSPQDDNGYDISDYRDIDPLFGTLDDMDELLAEAHRRGLKIVMDLVVNHTSDEHAWFEASKDKDANGRLPGEYGSELQDLPVGEEGYSSPNPFCADGPRQDEFLAEMRREVFDGRDGFLTVGEAPGITAERNEHITDPANGELDMLFLFEHMGVDQTPESKWDDKPWTPADLETKLAEQQDAIARHGWASLFLDNHDQPRVVSRWGDDTSKTGRIRSAKALALLLHMHRGTPYVYQGEELGMTNAHFTSLDQYRDLESINAYHQRVEETGIRTSETMMRSLARYGRDNARTPMQWDDSTYAGFTMSDAPVEPWIAVNPNHTEINAADEIDDPDSVYSFHKRLIALRHTDPVVAAGDYRRVETGNDRIIAFTRTLDERTILTVINLSPTQAAPAGELETMPDGTILIANTDDPVGNLKTTGTLGPWEAFAMETDPE